MFGYIKVFKPELKFKEYEVYKGIYCSLCKELGRDYGLLSRMTLNYDFTFLALCRMAMNDKRPEFSPSHCSFRPDKKCICCQKGQEDLQYSAAVSVMTVYHKVLDNISDGNFLSKLGMYIILPLIKSKYKKAKSKYPEVALFIEEQMSRQKQIESEKDASIDSAVDPTACSLGYIMSYGLEGDQKIIADRFGYCMGRLIYLLDASDDFEKDKKSGNFNPFVINEKKYGDKLNENIVRMLNVTADENAKAYELLNIKRFKSIIDNIIYYGFDSEIKKVQRKGEDMSGKSV